MTDSAANDREWREEANQLLRDMASDARGDEPHIPLPPLPDGYPQGFEDGYVEGRRAAHLAEPRPAPAQEGEEQPTIWENGELRFNKKWVDRQLDSGLRAARHPYEPRLNRLVDRFLAWPLPKSVCSDGCVCDSKYPYPRSGTNLLNADEARQMLEYVLRDEPKPQPSLSAQAGELGQACEPEVQAAVEPVAYPNVPAAFINVIAEEGTKAEAVEWLQKTWNELCWVRAQQQSHGRGGDAKDAARWKAIEHLWFLGTVELTTNSLGHFEIRVEPAEGNDFAYEGLDQADTVDAAVEAINAPPAKPEDA